LRLDRARIVGEDCSGGLRTLLLCTVLDARSHEWDSLNGVSGGGVRISRSRRVYSLSGFTCAAKKLLAQTFNLRDAGNGFERRPDRMGLHLLKLRLGFLVASRQTESMSD
jgi:hypothetical protein